MAVVGDGRSGDPLHKRVEYNCMSHIYYVQLHYSDASSKRGKNEKARHDLGLMLKMDTE